MLGGLWAFGACFSAAVQCATFSGKVVFVLDGDTVLVAREGGKPVKVRLAGIDAPERAQPFGAKSRQFLSDQVLRREVRVEVVAIDKYGRRVANLRMNGHDINREMVGSGMAWDYSRWRQHSRYDELQRQARQAKRGLWGQPQPQPPWQWRKSHAQPSWSQHALPGDFVCGRKTRCDQMKTCDEAHFFLSYCKVAALDTDGDGIPCPVR